MNFHFYLQGGVIPAVYDFDLSASGMISPAKIKPTRNRGCVMIVLENGGGEPTAEQRDTLNQLFAVNPHWGRTFFFQTELPMAV